MTRSRDFAKVRLARVVGILFMLATGVLLAWVIGENTGRPFLGTMSALFLGLSVVQLARLGFLRLYHSRARERVLLDCGPHPHRERMYIGIVFFVLGVLLTAVGMFFAPPDEGIPVFMIVLWFVAGGILLQMASERLLLLEEGIWMFGVLIPWETIASYEWLDGSNLFVRTRGAMSLLTSNEVLCPRELRDVIDLQLKSHGVQGSAS